MRGKQINKSLTYNKAIYDLKAMYGYSLMLYYPATSIPSSYHGNTNQKIFSIHFIKILNISRWHFLQTKDKTRAQLFKAKDVVS